MLIVSNILIPFPCALKTIVWCLEKRPAKMSLFFFGNNFYKNKETFKIFSLKILEVCRILLVQTTLESPKFYHTFLVINDRFDWGTALLYDSSNSNVKIAHNCIGHFLWNMSDFSSGVVFENFCSIWIVFINYVFQVPPQKIVRGWDQGNRVTSGYWFEAKWVCPMESTDWGIQEFCLSNEVALDLAGTQ